MNSILLIDDTHRLLEELVEGLKGIFSPDEVEIRTWEPSSEQANSLQQFESLVDEGTLLVVTDYDLTSQGHTGLFGSSIVGWCQSRAIPVGDYSRGNHVALPKEPNLFELRVPTDPTGSLRSASFIASVYHGFRTIKEQLSTRPELLKMRSPAVVLAGLLDVPHLESQFSLYGGRLGTSNGALLDKIVRTAPENIEPDDAEKQALLGYIVGHLLLNAVLRFPGPILSSRALLAYVGCDMEESESICDIFAEAIYGGPFSELDKFFWLHKVDALLDVMQEDLPNDCTAETDGELNRIAVEKKIGRALKRHGCHRCEGKNGGFLCPFTDKTVCQKPDCSVGSNSWVPQGARISRIERDFYDEWAPILGI